MHTAQSLVGPAEVRQLASCPERQVHGGWHATHLSQRHYERVLQRRLVKDLPLHVRLEVLYKSAPRQELDGHLCWRRPVWIQRSHHAPKGALPQDASLRHQHTAPGLRLLNKELTLPFPTTVQAMQTKQTQREGPTCMYLPRFRTVFAGTVSFSMRPGSGFSGSQADLMLEEASRKSAQAISGPPSTPAALPPVRPTWRGCNTCPQAIEDG